MTTWLLCLLLLIDNEDWQKQEAVHLTNIRQVTKDFVRAGEGYFSPDGKQIIFQAEEKGTGNPFYQIFVHGPGHRASIAASAPASARTTCSYFSPDGKKIIFASSHLDPDAKKHYAEEIQQRRRRTRRKASTAAINGTSIPTWTSSRPIPTART